MHPPTVSQMSLVQPLLSSQAALFGTLMQPSLLSHWSNVQSMPSLQSSGTPMQMPPEQISPPVHKFLSSQLVPAGAGNF